MLEFPAQQKTHSYKNVKFIPYCNTTQLFWKTLMSICSGLIRKLCEKQYNCWYILPIIFLEKIKINEMNISISMLT